MAQDSSITQAEVIPYWLPFRRDYVTARGRLARREMVLLRLRDEQGFQGWGEAVPLSLRGGESLERVVADLSAWADQLLASGAALPSRPSDPVGAASPAVLAALSAPARCAALTALVDLEARRHEIPLWLLLGAERAEPVPCNATLVSGTPEEVAEDAGRWAAEGFTTFKLKAGLRAGGPIAASGDPDLEMIAAVRERIGDRARIRLDANGAWSLDRAEAVLRAAAPLGIELVEQPVSRLDEMAELRRRLARSRETAIPIAADESVSSPAEASRAREQGACDLATVKLSKLGQMLPDLGGFLPFYLSSALDGPVGIAAAAHAYQALDEGTRAALAPSPASAPTGGAGTASGGAEPLAQGLATARLFAETVASRECQLRGSELHLPPGPGLGLEIDDDALRAHRL